MARTPLFVIVAFAACERPAVDANVAPVEVQCARDKDCVLLPSVLTCCNECPPAPPFEAAPTWVLDGMLIENETDCAEPRHLCLPDACDPVPARCVARAACIAGTCIAVANACD